MPYVIHDAGPGSTSAVSRLLVKAFADDPLMTFILPDADRRACRLPFLIEGIVAYTTRYGILHSVGDGVGGACWLPPGATQQTNVRLLRSGLALRSFRVGSDGLGRLMRATAAFDAAHHRVVPDDHWYLRMIGTDPLYQRSGVARALIEDGLARADADCQSTWRRKHHAMSITTAASVSTLRIRSRLTV